jgi:membrane protein DedA with SNARE-associated domain
MAVPAEFSGGPHEAWRAAAAWLAAHEGLVLFLAVFLEECGIPMPIPADLAVALAGHRVARGQMRLLEAFLVVQAATLLGSSVLYWAGYRGGRPLLFRYGRLLHLPPHRIGQVERLVIRLGPLAVVIGRQIPGLRLAAPLACGVFRIPYLAFVPAMVVGSSLYIGAFLLLGMWGGAAMLGALRLGVLPVRFLATTLVLVVAAVLLGRLSRRVRRAAAPVHRLAAARRRAPEAALLAGLGATALMGLTVTWLLTLLALVGETAPERSLLLLLEGGTLTLPALDASAAAPAGAWWPRWPALAMAGLLLTVPLLVVSQMGWALVYAVVGEPRLRGSAGVRGLQFAALPFVCSGLVLLPLLGAGPFGLGLGAGWLPVAGELVRHAVFGAALGTLYRLTRWARQPRLHEGHRHGHRHQIGVQTGALGSRALPRPA